MKAARKNLQNTIDNAIETSVMNSSKLFTKHSSGCIMITGPTIPIVEKQCVVRKFSYKIIFKDFL